MMMPNELKRFTEQWAAEAAEHAMRGDAVRMQQNENYWRRILLAHVTDPQQRMALSVLRRALVQQKLDEWGAA